MPNNYLSVLYKHRIQVENENVELKVVGHNQKCRGHVPPCTLPTPPCFLDQCITITCNSVNAKTVLK